MAAKGDDTISESPLLNSRENSTADEENMEVKILRSEIATAVKTSNNCAIIWKAFNVVCFITGQFYFKKPLLSIFIIPFILTFGFMNLYSTAFNFYVMTCHYEDCGYIDTEHKKTLYFVGITAMTSHYYSNFQKFVFTFACLSGTLSYFFMLYSLNTKHIKSLIMNCSKKMGKDGRKASARHAHRSEAEPKDVDKYPIFPFSVKSALKPKQVCIFWLIFVLNFAVYLGSAFLFFTILFMTVNKSDSVEAKFWDCFGLVSQFVSWFCAILSCFIFSKIAYSVSNYCVFDLKQQLEEVDKNEINGIYGKLNEKFKLNLVSSCPDNNVSYFHILKDVDKHYGEVMRQSLEAYSSWFAVHWLCYTVAAFLSVSYVIQHIVRDMYSDDSHCKGEKHLMCRLSLAYNFLFSVSHCILFLYPCFRAASVTASRYKIIRMISRAHWTRVPLEQKQAFLQYMELEDCTFKVSIMCATVTFGFNLAYFSIFAGIMTVILKISL